MNNNLQISNSHLQMRQGSILGMPKKSYNICEYFVKNDTKTISKFLMTNSFNQFCKVLSKF